MKPLTTKLFRHKYERVNSVLFIAVVFTGILLFTAVSALMLVRELNTGTTDVSVNWLPSVIIAEELNTATSDFRIEETSHVISQDPADMVIHEARIMAITRDIESMFSEYGYNLVTNDTDKAMIELAYSLWEEYLRVHQEMISYSKNNDTTAAMLIMENESKDLFEEVSSLFSQLVAFNKEGADQASSDGDDLYQFTIVVVLAIVLLSILVFRKFKALIIEIEEGQEKLQLAHEEAILYSKAKSNFLANMSHEIRTPMNAISGMTDIILRETEKTEVSEYAHNIKRACDSLLSIINDVLDISKIESGKLDIVEGSYQLAHLLNDVINIANARLELKDLMFTTDFQRDLPNQLLGDDVRVKQVMVNILNNAIKFTQSGHVALKVRGTYIQGRVQLKIQISDTGAGISPEDLDKLFIEFERVNTTKNRTIEGTGLGLAISKRLCEMMEGNIQVESQVGVGSTFTINILQKYQDYAPLAQVETPKSVLIFEGRDLYRNSLEEACTQLNVPKRCCALQSELNEALNEQQFDYIFTSCMYLAKVEEMLQKHKLQSKIILLADNAEIKSKYDYSTIIMPVSVLSLANLLNGTHNFTDKSEDLINFVAPSCHVLVVDDNLVNLKVAKGLMKPYQFQISTAENGQEAVELVRNNTFDMVFMDHMMPIMDGIDATIAIRKIPGEYYQNLPIVALTANAIIGTQEMFIQEGMNDFLAKPIKIATLHEIIAKWLPKEKQIVQEGADQEEEVPSPEAQQDQPIQIPKVDTALGVARIGGDFDTYLDILNMYYKDGLKRSASILKFYQEKQLESYKIEVHALKSASASIGALEISESARALEEAAIQEDWVCINRETGKFLADFEELLEQIRVATLPFHVEEDQGDKEPGDPGFFQEGLAKLEEALDLVDISLCDQLLEGLYQFSWPQDQAGKLTQIKEFISSYEYDEATELIQEMREGS